MPCEAVSSALRAVPKGRDDGCPGWERLLHAAWREERRHPEISLQLVEAVLTSFGTDSTVAMAKACFLKAKLHIEGCGNLHTGLLWLSQALSNASQCIIRNAQDGEPKATLLTPLEVSGWVFHLCRTLFFVGCESCSLIVAEAFTSQQFPAAWPIADKVQPAAAACSNHECVLQSDLTSICKAASLTTNKYHLGTLLHSLIVMSTSRLDLLPACAASVLEWLPLRRQDLSRQFNAEIRYATVIERLLPFPSTSSTPTVRVTLLGDSHILPAAWHVFQDNTGITVQLQPQLVMGLKAWHFNPALITSRERDILACTLPLLPKGCPLLVSAGEIDLREEGPIANLPAYFHASRPAKYASTAEALDATMAAFVTGLVALQGQVEAMVVVQAVRPPPRSTAHLELISGLVQLWNSRLMVAVAELEHVACMHLPDLGERVDGNVVLR